MTSYPTAAELDALIAGLDSTSSEQIVDIREICASPDLTRIAFTATCMIDGRPASRLAIAKVAQGPAEIITSGPGDDMQPRWSPDGKRLAFLSDRAERGRPQGYLLSIEGPSEARALPRVDGAIEALSWSNDGRRILLVAAEPGADRSSMNGAVALELARAEEPWAPKVLSSRTVRGYRRASLVDLESGSTVRLDFGPRTVWEACWCGPNRVAAIATEAPEEGAWYRAKLYLREIAGGEARLLYDPEHQLGLLAGAPSGAVLAFVDTYCSDRGVIAGRPRFLDLATGSVTAIDVGCDATHLVWIDDCTLLFVGIRSLETVVGQIDYGSGTVRELWASEVQTTGNFLPTAEPLGPDRWVVATECYTTPPRITVYCPQGEIVLLDCGHQGIAAWGDRVGEARPVAWRGQDALEIHGWLIEPVQSPLGPAPLVVNIHGGPVWSHRQRWFGRSRTIAGLAALGCATLLPNPRGSAGRGLAFAEMVRGDPGGGEAADILAGVDAMVAAKIADPSRLGVIGGSHGGYLSAWLIGQTQMFAAAVSASPCTDWISFHHTSSIPEFDELLLGCTVGSGSARFVERSPISHAGQVRTPTLIVGGQEDRCTPPGQAIEFYNALRMNGVEAELALYPGEGHGFRGGPAAQDVTMRSIEWFRRHLRLGA